MSAQVKHSEKGFTPSSKSMNSGVDTLSPTLNGAKLKRERRMGGGSCNSEGKQRL